MRALTALPLPLLLAATACTTAVRHPEKSAAETSADIAACDREVRAVHWAPLTIRTKISECLAAKGYLSESPAVASALPPAAEPAERPAPGEVPVKPERASVPCEVPCRTKS